MKPKEKEATQPDELLPRSRFDTRSMDAKQALSSWQENIDAMFDVRVHDSEDTFRVTMDAFMLGDLMLANVSHVAAQSYERSIRRIGRDGVDHYCQEDAVSFADVIGVALPGCARACRHRPEASRKIVR